MGFWDFPCPQGLDDMKLFQRWKKLVNRLRGQAFLRGSESLIPCCLQKLNFHLVEWSFGQSASTPSVKLVQHFINLPLVGSKIVFPKAMMSQRWRTEGTLWLVRVESLLVPMRWWAEYGWFQAWLSVWLAGWSYVTSERGIWLAAECLGFAGCAVSTQIPDSLQDPLHMADFSHAQVLTHKH